VQVVVGTAGLLGLLWSVVVAAPPWFVDDESLEGLKAQNEVRTTLLQGLGGIVLLVGAYFTWRQLHTAREGQITERYTRAIGQLGHAQLDVRLGGIYALERIARDSGVDRHTIGEVLTAFVRTHAPYQPTVDDAGRVLSEQSELKVRAPDVQAIVTVLGRGGFAPPRRDGDRLDLTGVDLRRASLDSPNLEGADLSYAHLERATLRGAHLKGAILRGAYLEGADLSDADLDDAQLSGAYLEGAILRGAYLYADFSYAHLESANLSFANLEGAYLGDADLKEARLYGARLNGARLTNAHLEGANLTGGVDLTEAALTQAHLEGAVADDLTSWPDGFDWRAAGVIPWGEDSETGPQSGA
jgi:uncharacterized protein YjbI with pentapeptide repeats